MRDTSLSFSHVVFGYPSAAGLLFDDLSCVFPPGWTGVVGFNGCGKTTLLSLAAGLLQPEAGTITCSGRALLCAQECDTVPAGLAELLSSPGRRAAELRETLALKEEWTERWETLSFGERKRSQIGCALFGDSGILCLDEPTNHLDRDSIEALKEALRGFGGVGLLVSHDRELLDEFCEQCLFLDPEGALMRPGNWSEGKRQREIERERDRNILAGEKAALLHMRKELQRRRQNAQAAEAKNSKRKLDRYDYDGKGMIDAARITGRGSAANNLVRRQRSKVESQQKKVEVLSAVREEAFGLDIPYGSRSGRNRLFRLDAGELALGGGRVLYCPELEMAPDDRIGIVGGNGLGKSTLIRKIVGQLTIGPEHVLYLPQEVVPGERERLAERLAALSPRQLGNVMRVIHSLGSSPERVLASARLSPGELRKLELAMGVNDDIQLLIMDEPTNHLDLPSVECLERALSDMRPALLLVSHDWRFLRNLCRRRWIVEPGVLRTGFWN